MSGMPAGLVMPGMPGVVGQSKALGGVQATYPAEMITYGTAAPVAGSAGIQGTTWFVAAGRPIWRDGTFDQAQIRANASGNVQIKICRRSGNVISMVSEQAVAVISGLNTIAVTPTAVLAGDFFAVYSATNGTLMYTSVAGLSGTEYYSVGGDMTTTTTVGNITVPFDTVRFEMNFRVSVAETPASPAIGDPIYLGEPSPTTGTDYAGIAESVFEDHAFIAPMRLETLEIYAGAAGLLMVFVLTRTAAGYSYRPFSITIASGTNNLVAGTHFPVDVVVPAGGMIGYWNCKGNSIRNDTNTVRSRRALNSAITGGAVPTASLTGFSSNVSVGLQIKAGFRKTAALATTTTRLDYTFSNYLHPEFDVAGWSIVAGKAQNSATGLGNGVTWRRGGDYDGTVSAWVTFSGATDKFAVYRKPVLSFGTVATINLTGNIIAIHEIWDGSSTLPAIQASKTSTIAFQTAREYRVDLARDSLGDLVLTVTDTVDLTVDTLTFTSFNGAGALSYVAGRAFGNPGFAALTGTVDVSRTIFATPVAQPKVMIFGDSISDGQGATSAANSWAGKVRIGVGGSALIAAVGGVSSAYSLTNVEYQIRQFLPQHVILLIGTNDTVAATWKANIDKLVEFVGMTGATLWIGAVPAEAADSNPESEFNPYLRSNYASKVISFDQVLTTGGTGLGADRNAALYTDTEHPNDAGYALMYTQVQSDAPSIFI